MVDRSDFRKYAHQFVDWMADYLENVESYPVKSLVAPGDIFGQIPENPPEEGDSMECIFEDFQSIILPGITHWQHPNFYAYFSANSSPPSLLAEMLTAALATQCMSWQTSPAATELEERMMEWLAQMIGLPEGFVGVIHEGASVATLSALLSAREKASSFAVNQRGFQCIEKPFTVYCSSEAHSSVTKAVRIAGIGDNNLRYIDVDEQQAICPNKLESKVRDDLSKGYNPLFVVAAMGSTGTLGMDSVGECASICKRYNMWLHVDAAYAGSALILPEYHYLIQGIEDADSFVFNPHKWMFTNFDCSAYFVKDKDVLLKTFSILPEYLKTKEDDEIKNYRDWGVPLGRRFRALKLWFVIRSYGLENLQNMIRNHIELAQSLADTIDKSENFELMTPVKMNLVCFRYHPRDIHDEETLDEVNSLLMEQLNATGKLYLTHTKINGRFILRMSIGQTYVEKHHVDSSWETIRLVASKMNIQPPSS